VLYSLYAWRRRLLEKGPVRFALMERSAPRQERHHSEDTERCDSFSAIPSQGGSHHFAGRRMVARSVPTTTFPINPLASTALR
jgi:hypothetical protein